MLKKMDDALRDLLAINGGTPVRTTPFPAQLTVGEEEAEAAAKVINSKNLSGYRGSWNESFMGGAQVQALEREFAYEMCCEHAIAVNSCTTALQLACGAVGIGVGDEVIVAPWSMSCSATAPMMWGAVPVFADIEPEHFCISYEQVEYLLQTREKIKAIIIVDLFGQPFDPRIRDLARVYNIPIIEDAAQAIGAEWKEQTPNKFQVHFAGTLGDIGCFSFTQGKHLTAGEGGMLVTNNPIYAARLRMMRNHADAVFHSMRIRDDKSTPLPYPYSTVQKIDEFALPGFNVRMTEIQAAILRIQLDRLDDYVAMRQQNAEALERALNDAGINVRLYGPRDECTHAYYVSAWRMPTNWGSGHIKAVAAELPGEEGRPDKDLIRFGYTDPLWCLVDNASLQMQSRERCEVVRALQKWGGNMFIMQFHALPLTTIDIHDIVKAFVKVGDCYGK